MTKHLPTVAGALLGLLFVAVGLMVLLGLGPPPEAPPAGTPPAHFFAAFGPTGYLTFVKVLEVLGGLLVAVPKTRGLGLLVLGPIVVNILAFHVFVAGDGVADPMLLAICALALYLLWVERAPFLGLVRRATRTLESPSPSAHEMLVGLTVDDDRAYQEYREAMAPLLAAHGGGFRYDFTIAKVLKSASDHPINRVFAIYFGSKAQMGAFFAHADYQAIKAKFFQRSVTGTTIFGAYDR